MSRRQEEIGIVKRTGQAIVSSQYADLDHSLSYVLLSISFGREKDLSP